MEIRAKGRRGSQGMFLWIYLFFVISEFAAVGSDL